MKIQINCGSGQRKFDREFGWINLDVVSRPDQVPDLVCDGKELFKHFGPESVDTVVLHHVLEHFGSGEADEVIRQSYKVLKPGGSLLVFVPDMHKLAGRWLGGEIDDYIFFVNAYGAYQGEPGDRHAWGFSKLSLFKALRDAIPNESIVHIPFDWREIPGANIAKDWWVLGVEVIK